MAQTSSNAKGAMFALLSFGVFATHDVFIKNLGGSYAAIQVVFFSVLLGFPILTLMLMTDATPGTLRPRHPWWMLARTVSATVTAVSAFTAFAMLPLAQTYAILFSQPLLITVLAIPVLGETVRLRRWIAVLVGLLGVLIVLRPGQTELGIGHFAALAAGLGGAVNSIIVRKIGQEERSVVLLLYPMLGNFLLAAVALPFFYTPMPLTDFGGVAIVALFGFIAMRFLIAAYRYGEAVIVAPMQYSQIIWATVFGYFLFEETIDIWTGVGAAVIIGSGLYILLRESNSDASENTPVLRTRTRIGTPGALRISHMLRRGGAKTPTPKKPDQ